MFLFLKSGTFNTRTLGLLRMNGVHKKLVTDYDGFFRLFTEDKRISPKVGGGHKFKISPRLENAEDWLPGGSLLLFNSKFDLFKFLLSDDAAKFDYLQFDLIKIEICEDTVNRLKRKIEYSIRQEIYQDSLDLVSDVAEVAENGEKGRVTIKQ
eukprot:GFUD01045524.1.p1 GENE.GFUD01045524.1~~GFUD01045524.1.p1  ORF type:complete len:153 (-),score=39.17 GFUD01045524.1:240-698(-)